MDAPKAYYTNGKGIKLKMRKNFRKLGKREENKTTNERGSHLDHLGSLAVYNTDSC